MPEDVSIFEAENRVGTTLVDRYRIESIVQKGGMGTVFKATHLELGKTVAVKIFHPYLSHKKELTVRFINEAKGTANMHHRNIVDIIDIGADENNVPFFVMEFLKGESLRERMKRFYNGLAPAESVDILIQILTGLHVAHARGIIHRDLKPGNIYIAREEDGSEIVKILDFGVAKFRELGTGENIEITTDGSIIGTPSYMSPEQAMGKHKGVDSRSDLYSCGVILYRCLTGLNPFKGSTQLETIQNIISLDPPRPSFITNRVPKEMDKIVLKAIHKDKEQRYPDCKAFVEDLKFIYDVCEAQPAEAVEKLVKGKITLSEIVPEDASAQREFTVDQSALEFSQPGDSIPGTLQKEKPGFSKIQISIGVIIIVLLVFLAGWIVSFTLSNNRKQGAMQGGAQETSSSETDKSAAAEEKETAGQGTEQVVNIKFFGLPKGARVFVDGILREGNPVALKQSSKPVEILVNHEGKELLRKSIVPEKDETLLVASTGKEGKKVWKPGKKPPKGGKKAGSSGSTSSFVPDESTEKPTEKPAEKPAKKPEEKEEKQRKIYKVFPELGSDT